VDDSIERVAEREGVTPEEAGSKMLRVQEQTMRRIESLEEEDCQRTKQSTLRLGKVMSRLIRDDLSAAHGQTKSIPQGKMRAVLGQ
jgi:hypothetical protein